MVQILCNKHAEIGASAADDMAAIHFASQKGHTEVVRILLTSGASIHSRTRKGMTPLHYAAHGSHLDVAKVLIKKGAHLYSPNKAGKKALDLAKDEEFRNVLIAIEKESKESRARGKEVKGAVHKALPCGIGTESDIVRDEEKKEGLTKDEIEKDSAVDEEKKEANDGLYKDNIEQDNVLNDEKKKKHGVEKDYSEEAHRSPPRKKTRAQSSPLNETDKKTDEDGQSKDELITSPRKKVKAELNKVNLSHLETDEDES